MNRLFPDRIAGRRDVRGVKRTHSYSADGGVAISRPIERAAPIRAEMKSNAKTAVGIAFVDFPLAIESHPIFWITRTEMESGAGRGAGTPCSGTGRPDPVHPWELLEASRSGIARSVPPSPLSLV